MHGTEGSIIASGVMTQAPVGEVVLVTGAGRDSIRYAAHDLDRQAALDFSTAVAGHGRPAADGWDGVKSLTIALANDATYGLSAGVWSEIVHTCLDFARRVQAGTIWTNTWMDGFPEVTFGGMKQSGSGREIGPYGLKEFLEVKTVAMRIGRTRAPWAKTR